VINNPARVISQIALTAALLWSVAIASPIDDALENVKSLMAEHQRDFKEMSALRETIDRKRRDAGPFDFNLFPDEDIAAYNAIVARYNAREQFMKSQLELIRALRAANK